LVLEANTEALSCSGLLGLFGAYLPMALEDRVTSPAATGNLQGELEDLTRFAPSLTTGTGPPTLLPAAS
jgi:hypothetical protein